MRLHKQPRLFLVGFAQVLARLDGLGKARIQIVRLRNPGAVRAFAAEIRQPVGRGRGQAVQSLRQHQRQRVLPRSVPPREHHSMRKMVARQHIAQAMNRFRVPVKIRKRHFAFETTKFGRSANHERDFTLAM